MSVSISKEGKIIVVGAGCFGISSALHLLKRGYRDVTVLYRSEVLPAPEAASTDINKSKFSEKIIRENALIHWLVVRSSYTDEFYSRFGREAITLWKNKEEWDNVYHE